MTYILTDEQINRELSRERKTHKTNMQIMEGYREMVALLEDFLYDYETAPDQEAVGRIPYIYCVRIQSLLGENDSDG